MPECFWQVECSLSKLHFSLNKWCQVQLNAPNSKVKTKTKIKTNKIAIESNPNTNKDKEHLRKKHRTKMRKISTNHFSVRIMKTNSYCFSSSHKNSVKTPAQSITSWIYNVKKMPNMHNPIYATYAKDDMSCMHCESPISHSSRVFQGPNFFPLWNMALAPAGFCQQTPHCWTFIRDSGCAPPPLPAAVFLSIQWLRLPREILLSVFDIPVQKRNSDNGIFDPFQEIVSGEGRVKISSTFRHFLHPLSFFANDTNTHTHMSSKLEKFSSSPDLILEGWHD